MRIIEKYWHFKQLGRHICRWIFIHCYRPRELPTRYASTRILTRNEKKKTNPFIGSSVHYFAEWLNGEQMRGFFFFNIHLFHILVLYVMSRSIYVVLVPAVACDSGQMVKLSLSRKHCAFHEWDVNTHTRPNTHSAYTGIIVRSSYSMPAHTTDTIHIKPMIYTSAIKYRKWANIFIKIHWAINLWNFWFISCLE